MTMPNLSLEHVGGRVNRWNECIYATQGQLSEARNIPLCVLKAAKRKSAPGFVQDKTIVNWAKLQPWLMEHYQECSSEIEPERTEEPKGDKRDRLELKKLEQEVKKLENFNRSKSADFISRKLVISTHKRIASEWTSLVSRYLIHEQPSKCSGMEEIALREANQEFITKASAILSTPLNEWEQAKDLETEERPEVKPDEPATD